MSSAWALIENDGEVLFVRRALDRGRGGQWCLPGGTMWKNERPEVACVREAFEETGLRVTVLRPIAVFRSAHYFLCRLNSPRDLLDLRRCECIDSSWTDPQTHPDAGHDHGSAAHDPDPGVVRVAPAAHPERAQARRARAALLSDLSERYGPCSGSSSAIWSPPASPAAGLSAPRTPASSASESWPAPPQRS